MPPFKFSFHSALDLGMAVQYVFISAFLKKLFIWNGTFSKKYWIACIYTVETAGLHSQQLVCFCGIMSLPKAVS